MELCGVEAFVIIVFFLNWLGVCSNGKLTFLWTKPVTLAVIHGAAVRVGDAVTSTPRWRWRVGRADAGVVQWLTLVAHPIASAPR